MLLDIILELDNKAFIKTYFALLKLSLPNFSTYATNKQIAYITNLNRHTVSKAIQKMQKLNYIRVYNNTSTAYRKIQFNTHHLARLKDNLEHITTFIYLQNKYE